MNFTGINKEPLYGVRIGIMFYFYQDPIKVRGRIKELFKEFSELVTPEFKYYKHNTPTMKKIKKDSIELFNGIIDNEEYINTCTFCVTDSTEDKLQSSKVEFVLRTIGEDTISKMPNRIYFEFEPNINPEEVKHFIRRAFHGLTYHYATCDVVVGINDHLIPKSMSEGIKQLRETKVFSEKYSVLSNPFYLKNASMGILQPSALQVISESMYNKVGFDRIMEAEKYIQFELGEDYLMLGILDEEWPYDDIKYVEKYKKMAKLLEPIIISTRKPQKYWKEQEWIEWNKRFN